MQNLSSVSKINDSILQESHFIPLNQTDQLHLKRFYSNEGGIPVFMLHGSIENGKIFYSTTGKGLAPFLAQHGFDVFVADMRGRGLSTPPTSRDSDYGLTECILQEIPVFLEEIKKIKGDIPMHFIGHSWGGILLLCYCARFSQQGKVSSMVFFGTKRQVTIKGVRKFVAVDLVYDYVFRLVVAVRGYVDSRMLGIGSDNETRKSQKQTFRWVTKKEWKDEDGFDYLSAFKKTVLPPALFIAGSRDRVLGNTIDVKVLMKEIAQPHSEFYLASHENGNLHDYGHINMLTHPDAPKDHFQYVLKWMKKFS